MKTILATVVATLAAVAAGGHVPAQVPSQASSPAAAQELPPIRNFLQVTPQFCTGGQPRPEHFAKLKADGVKAVLNLRTPGEYRADEEQAAVEKAGNTSTSLSSTPRRPMRRRMSSSSSPTILPAAPCSSIAQRPFVSAHSG